MLTQKVLWLQVQTLLGKKKLVKIEGKIEAKIRIFPRLFAGIAIKEVTI